MVGPILALILAHCSDLEITPAFQFGSVSRRGVRSRQPTRGGNRDPNDSSAECGTERLAIGAGARLVRPGNGLDALGDLVAGQYHYLPAGHHQMDVDREVWRLVTERHVPWSLSGRIETLLLAL